MPRAATSLSLSPGTLSQCKPERVFDREMTREIGSELELPKTWHVSYVSELEMRTSHRHGYQEIGGALFESA